jgi:hypothetical protein
LSSKIQKREDIPGAVYLRSVRLQNSFDVKRLLAKIVNLCLQGKIAEARASRITYILGVLLKAIEQSELEQRITKIENKILIIEDEED